VGRGGVLAGLVKMKITIEKEMHFVARSIHIFHVQHRVRYSDIPLLYRIKKDNRTLYVDIIRKVLEKSKLPYCRIA
jgi:hypothetical protein